MSNGTKRSGGNEALKQRAEKVLIGNYGVRDLALVRGEGMYVWDADGKKYLDFLAGIAVNILGHCPPVVADAVSKQVRTLIHVSNLYLVEPQIELAELLCAHGGIPDARCFFCNSGTEANEAAIKLSRRYWHDRGKDKFEIISAEESFHGRTLGSITATGQPKYHQGFAPLVPGFKYVPFNNIAALEAAMTGQTAAVLLEPIQCEGGINIPSGEYMRQVRELCDTRGALLILDEVQTGNGRTGRLFAFQHMGMVPDIVTTAKGLAGGLPIGAMLARAEIASAFVQGTHAATFGGNPLVCAAAIAVIKELLEPGFLDNVSASSAWFLKHLKQKLSGFKRVKDIRGVGFIFGVQVDGALAEYVKQFRARGILVGSAGKDVVRFVPPLIAQREHFELVADAFVEVLRGTAD